MPGLRRLLPLLVLFAATGTPAGVLADNPGVGQVIVPADHVMPGETFPVTGYDLDEGADLSIRLTNGATSVDLGVGRVATDGTLATVAALPASFPNGYAELTATSFDGGRWSTFVLVGPRAEGPEAVSNAVNAQLLALVLAAFAITALAVVGWRYARR